MATGGRVRHHPKHKLWRENSSVIFVGFAARGTLARQIIDSAKSVNLFGQEIPIRARLYTINGFSPPADQAELIAWQRQVDAPRTFLVHGEEPVMHQFASKLKDTLAVTPEPGQEFEL
jgi:metallo-beta-lactamase family protein